jgi:hypothetical protein
MAEEAVLALMGTAPGLVLAPTAAQSAVHLFRDRLFFLTHRELTKIF